MVNLEPQQQKVHQQNSHSKSDGWIYKRDLKSLFANLRAKFADLNFGVAKRPGSIRNYLQFVKELVFPWLLWSLHFACLALETYLKGIGNIGNWQATVISVITWLTFPFLI